MENSGRPQDPDAGGGPLDQDRACGCCIEGGLTCTGAGLAKAAASGHDWPGSARHEAAWRLSYDILVIIDDRGVFLDVNPAFTELTGWTRGEVVGRTIFEFVVPEDHALSEAPLRDPAPAERSRVVNRYRTKDGSIRHVSWTGVHHGSLVYATGRDVTAEREQSTMLRQALRMEVMGRLTSGVAHDFNNFLAIIGTASQRLARSNLNEADRPRHVAAILDTVARAAKLTGQLLEFARVGPGSPEVFPVCGNLHRLVDMIRIVGGPGVKVVIECPDPTCLVQTDPAQFDTALINLVVNARDAMQGNGTLILTAGPVEVMPPRPERPARQHPQVAVSIADTGSGIPSDHLDRIFEPFFTTKEAGKGTGLGLSQVFDFVRQSDGDVTVNSVVGEGTVFTLYFPRVLAR